MQYRFFFIYLIFICSICFLISCDNTASTPGNSDITENPKIQLSVAYPNNDIVPYETFHIYNVNNLDILNGTTDNTLISPKPFISTYSNDSGIVTIEKLPAGIYNIVGVTEDGYSLLISDIKITEDPKEFFTFTEVLQKSGKLKGVCKLKKRTFDNADNINIYLEGTGFSTRVDEDGNYAFPNVPKGRYKITTHVPYSQKISKQGEAEVKSNKTTKVDTITIQLPRAFAGNDTTLFESERITLTGVSNDQKNKLHWKRGTSSKYYEAPYSFYVPSYMLFNYPCILKVTTPDNICAYDTLYITTKGKDSSFYQLYPDNLLTDLHERVTRTKHGHVSLFKSFRQESTADTVIENRYRIVTKTTPLYCQQIDIHHDSALWNPANERFTFTENHLKLKGNDTVSFILSTEKVVDTIYKYYLNNRMSIDTIWDTINLYFDSDTTFNADGYRVDTLVKSLNNHFYPKQSILNLRANFNYSNGFTKPTNAFVVQMFSEKGQDTLTDTIYSGFESEVRQTYSISNNRDLTIPSINCEDTDIIRTELFALFGPTDTLRCTTPIQQK